MLIFYHCLPRMVSDGTFATNEKGYITTDSFVQWFEHYYSILYHIRILETNDLYFSFLTIILLVYQRLSLIQFVGIRRTYYYLPALSSHFYSPKILDTFMYSSKQEVADISIHLGYLSIKTLPRHPFPKILMQAFNKISGSTVQVLLYQHSNALVYIPSTKGLLSVNDLIPETNKKKRKQSKYVQTTSSQDNNEQSICEHCGH